MYMYASLFQERLATDAVTTRTARRYKAPVLSAGVIAVTARSPHTCPTFTAPHADQVRSPHVPNTLMVQSANMVHVMVAHLNVNVKYLLGQHRIANGDTILLAAIQADDINVLIV